MVRSSKANNPAPDSAKKKLRQESLNALLKDDINKMQDTNTNPFQQNMQTGVLSMKSVWQAQKKKSPLEINVISGTTHHIHHNI